MKAAMQRNSNGDAVELSDSCNPESQPADFRPLGRRSAQSDHNEDQPADGYDEEACQGVGERLATTEATPTGFIPVPRRGLVLEHWLNPPKLPL